MLCIHICIVFTSETVSWFSIFVFECCQSTRCGLQLGMQLKPAHAVLYFGLYVQSWKCMAQDTFSVSYESPAIASSTKQ